MVFVHHNDGFAAQEDLRLMAACQHQVISNSTFSWWAAWLNQNPNKQIIAPTRWFADPKARNDDLIPLSWERIDNTQSGSEVARAA
jgi:Glycosyl transferase family 11